MDEFLQVVEDFSIGRTHKNRLIKLAEGKLPGVAYDGARLKRWLLKPQNFGRLDSLLNSACEWVEGKHALDPDMDVLTALFRGGEMVGFYKCNGLVNQILTSLL